MKNSMVGSLALAVLLAGCNQDCDKHIPKDSGPVGCQCTDSELADPNHLCCKNPGGVCQENSGNPPGACAYDLVNNQPVFQVVGFGAVTDAGSYEIPACASFKVSWSYFNQMNRTLLTPDKYGDLKPQLQIVDVLGLTATQTRDASQKQTESCQPDNHEEEFTGGIDPTTPENSHSGSFQFTIETLPKTVSGNFTFQKWIGQYDHSMCKT